MCTAFENFLCTYTFINDFGNILMFCKYYIFCTGYVAWIPKVCNPYEYIPKAQPTPYVCTSMNSVVEHQFLIYKIRKKNKDICLKVNRFKWNSNVFWIRGVTSWQKLQAFFLNIFKNIDILFNPNFVYPKLIPHNRSHASMYVFAQHS